MQLAEAIEPKQQAPELVFPTEQPLDCIEPLLEDGGIEVRLAASLWCFVAINRAASAICTDPVRPDSRW